MLLFYRRKSVNYTTNYNLKKPTDSDMYDVADFSGNMDLIDEQLKTNADDITDVEKPTFEDYTNPETEIPDADTAMAAIKSKTSIGVLFQNIKAFFKGVITIGRLVDNCTSTSTDLGLTANQGKVLMDRILGVEEDVSELNADALKKPTGQFTVESFWGPNWSGILRANIPFNCAAGQHIQINSIKGQNSEDIVLRGFGTANGYIALRTEETDKAFQGFTVVFTLT